jgi:hypothetical protein
MTMRCLKNYHPAALLVLLSMAGCTQWPQMSQPSAPPPATTIQKPAAAYLDKGMVKGDGEDGAVNAALAWSEKNVKLTEELLRAQQAKHDLEEANRKLSAQIVLLQGDAQASQKELADAHQMLQEMRKDLDQWKSNVLGFRDEIRQAEQAQAEALRKVLVLLGAEVPAAATSRPAASATERPATTQPAFTTAQRSPSGEPDAHK